MCKKINKKEIIELIKLQKSKKTRKKSKIFVVEGLIENKMALKGNFKLKKIFFCKKIIIKKKIDFCILKKFIFFVKKNIYKKITYRKKTEGILGVFFKKKINYENELNTYIKKKKYMFLIIDNIEKPGNIGAIIRTVEATKIINFIIVYNNKEIYNPNIIRSSIGCVFIVPIIKLSFNKILKYILNNNIYLLGTSIYKKNNICLYNQNFNLNKICIIFGNEHKGISKKWFKYIKKNIHIPMYGEINSLNVSVSVSMILFFIMIKKYIKNNIFKN
ncbi:MAG: RNA methyltransferase [Candidatus Shikimatogenerans bostrichidophilus]|nr:MAG: RNA methyltransferase [Candidatus Shikimatogenerans bostrichidophilus]